MTDELTKGMVKAALKGTAVVRAMNRDYQKARELRDRVWKKLEDIQGDMDEAGMISMMWTRDAGPVDTVLSDALGDALNAFTEGSGVEVLVTERREGEGVRPCQLEALQVFFPELDIKPKPRSRERCSVCGGLTQGGRADVGNLCECSSCDGCDAPYEDRWTDDNGNALCPSCRADMAARTRWKCDGCGATFDDQGVSPRIEQLIVQGGWTWENGKWTHFCPDKTVSEVTKVTQ